MNIGKNVLARFKAQRGQQVKGMEKNMAATQNLIKKGKPTGLTMIKKPSKKMQVQKMLGKKSLTRNYSK